MKGFLIFVALIVGASLYVLANTHELGQAAIASVEKDEGPNDQAFQDQMFGDPAKFAEKYRPMLQRRAQIAKVLPYAGEGDLMIDLICKTRDRYDQSSLANDPVYGDMLYRLAEAYEDQGGPIPAGEAATACKRYLALFPDGKLTVEVSAMMQRLSYKYNTH
jgi:hypothetical protein